MSHEVTAEKSDTMSVRCWWYWKCNVYIPTVFNYKIFHIKKNNFYIQKVHKVFYETNYDA